MALPVYGNADLVSAGRVRNALDALLPQDYVTLAQLTAAAPASVSSDIGDNVLSSFTIAHPFGTKDLIASVRDSVTGEVVYPTVAFDTINTVLVTFSIIPTLNQFRITIQK